MLSKEEAFRIRVDIRRYEAETGRSFRTAHIWHDGFYGKEVCLPDIEGTPSVKDKGKDEPLLFGLLTDSHG